MIKIFGFRVKCFFICFNVFHFFYSYFSEEFHSHITLFCSFLISGIAPLITWFYIRFSNFSRKSMTFLKYSSYSVFEKLLHVFLLSNFPSVIGNLITVKVLIISCFQNIFLNISQNFKDKIESAGVLFLQGAYSDIKVKQKWKEDFKDQFFIHRNSCSVLAA